MNNYGAADLAGRIIMAVSIIWLVIYIFTSIVDTVFTWKFILLVGGIIVGSMLHTVGSTNGSPADYQASNMVSAPKVSSS